MNSQAGQAVLATSQIEQAAAGNALAFAKIVDAYHADLVRVAYVVSGGSQELADDAVQSAWAIAWRKLGSVHHPESLKPWLVSVAANEARRLCRSQRRRAIVELDLGMRDPGAADPAERAEDVDLRRAIERLSAEDRALLAMRYEAGLDSAEIGALARRPASTIRWRLARIVARLRKELSDA